jgi:hypothetical protein
MATKKVIEIEVKDNLDKTSKGINDLNKEVKDLTNSADRLDKEFEDVSKTFDEVYGDLKPLTARLGEAEDRLYELALAGKQNTAEYKELLKATANFRQVQIQTDMVVDAAAQTMSQKLGGALQGAASGFSLVQGAMGLVGVESGDVEKALLKVNSAMALAQGVEGVRMAIPLFTGLATAIKTSVVGAFSTLKGAIASTGIGLLVVALGGLIYAVDEYNDQLDEEIDKTKKANEANKKYLDTLNEVISQREKERNSRKGGLNDLQREIDLLKAKGGSELEIFNKSKELTRKEIDNLKIRYYSYDQTKKAERDAALETYELLKDLKGKEEIQDAEFYKNQKEKQAQRNKEANDKAKESAQERLRIQNEANQNRVKFENDLLKSIEDLENEYFDSKKNLQDLEVQKVREKYFTIIEQAKGFNQDITTLEKARDEEIQKINQKYIDEANSYKLKSENDLAERLAQITQANYDAMLTAQQLELTAVNDKYFELENLAINNAEALAEIEIAKTNDLAKINEKYRKEQAQKDLELQLNKVQIASSTFSALGALTEAFAGKTEEEQKKAFEVKKAFDIAQAVLDGYKAVLSAYAHGNSIGGPILGGIEAGVAGAFAIAQIRKIEQSTFTPSTPSVGGGGTGGQQQQERIQAPTFNVIGEANQTQQVSDKPVKAYVVSGEVTTQQSLDRNRLRNATL